MAQRDKIWLELLFGSPELKGLTTPLLLVAGIDTALRSPRMARMSYGGVETIVEES